MEETGATRGLMLPAVRALLGRFDYVVFEIRRNALHILDALLPPAETSPYDFFVGPMEPSFAVVVPLLRRVQECGKSIIVRGMIVQEDFAMARNDLSWQITIPGRQAYEVIFSDVTIFCLMNLYDAECRCIRRQIRRGST